ncbi:MAG: hypothetical protein P1P89_13790 [Desulfobacterales bacterium]|nr:hypothetical protein [Desulfobacterales bacterium]
MDMMKCILKIMPDYQCTVRNNDYSTIEIPISEIRPLPSLTALENVWLQVQADELKEEEIKGLIEDLEKDVAWCFRFIATIWDVGAARGHWTAADITNQSIKDKYVDWKAKLERMAELGK